MKTKKIMEDLPGHADEVYLYARRTDRARKRR